MRFRALAIAVALLGAGCTAYEPDAETVAKWQLNMSEAALPGASDFRGHWVDIDVGAYFFSYTCPAGTTAATAFDALTKRIPAFSVHERGDRELALRQPTTNWDPAGFNEWRFLHDEPSQQMTVVYANLDSEMECHDWIVERLREYHARAKTQH